MRAVRETLDEVLRLVVRNAASIDREDYLRIICFLERVRPSLPSLAGAIRCEENRRKRNKARRRAAAFRKGGAS